MRRTGAVKELEMQSTERRKKVIDLQKDLVAKRDKCFVQTEPLGYAQDCNFFWHLSVPMNNRVPSRGSTEANDNNNISRYYHAKILLTMNKTVLLHWWRLVRRSTKMITLYLGTMTAIPMMHLLKTFCRMEYHKSGQLSNLPASRWGCLTTDRSLRRVIKLLDGCGIRGNALKKTLKEMLEGPKFSIVQSCLVTLENAMYDLINGIDQDDVATPSNILDTATNNNEVDNSSNGGNIHELIQSPSFRSELEL